MSQGHFGARTIAFEVLLVYLPHVKNYNSEPQKEYEQRYWQDDSQNNPVDLVFSFTVPRAARTTTRVCFQRRAAIRASYVGHR